MESQNLLTTQHSENGNSEAPLKIKVNSYHLFNDQTTYLNGSRLYYAYFEMVPSKIVLYNINYKRAVKWVENNLANQISGKHSREIFYKNRRGLHSDRVFYVLKNNIMILINDSGDVVIYFTQRIRHEAQIILNQLKHFGAVSTASFIHIVYQGDSGVRLKRIRNKKVRMKLSESYNDDLLPLHKNILTELKARNGSGLFLFHGKPGTGKTTYLRYLVQLLRRKSVIFLPPKLAGNLDSPALTTLLLDNKNSIFIIEDAENLLMARDSGNESSISMLLNITDGMLGESLGINVICTFNTQLSNIDKALLRKGRLKALYEFDALNIEKSKALIKKLGIENIPVTEPMTLADIYYSKEQSFEPEVNKRKQMGFAIHAA